VDHPLNEKGYRQSCELREAIQAARDGVGGFSSSPSEAATLRALLAAQAIWSSPLTRAIQTAIVGLHPLLQKSGTPSPGRAAGSANEANDTAGGGRVAFGAANEGRTTGGLERLGSAESTASALSEASRLWMAAAASGAAGGVETAGRQIELKPNAREKKNMGGRDTQGLVVGADCARRALAKLAEVAPAEEVRSFASAANLNCDEVDEAWWNTAPEGKDKVQERMRELLHQIHYSEHDTIVIVGHSHFFRAMFQVRAACARGGKN
jgi:broad specificity phosphatase PhoE